jgi:hypothetical protein
MSTESVTRRTAIECDTSGTQVPVLHWRWERASRGLLAEAGLKPPSAAATQKVVVVSDWETASIVGRQVIVEKVNESEPLITHREYVNAVKTAIVNIWRDQSEGCSAYCSDGSRCRGGTSSTWAPVWNVRKAGLGCLGK